jgi:hypothetical protein
VSTISCWPRAQPCTQVGLGLFFITNSDSRLNNPYCSRASGNDTCAPRVRDEVHPGGSIIADRVSRSEGLHIGVISRTIGSLAYQAL